MLYLLASLLAVSAECARPADLIGFAPPSLRQCSGRRSTVGSVYGSEPRFVQRKVSATAAGSRGTKAILDEAQPSSTCSRSLQDFQNQTGWRDGDRFLFGYGALLDRDVWRRRGIDESLGGKRRALRVVAAGRGLRFNVKVDFFPFNCGMAPQARRIVVPGLILKCSFAQGGWASVDSLPFESGATPEVHGIVVPVSDAELALHAAKEGGYSLGLLSLCSFRASCCYIIYARVFVKQRP